MIAPLAVAVLIGLYFFSRKTILNRFAFANGVLTPAQIKKKIGFSYLLFYRYGNWKRNTTKRSFDKWFEWNFGQVSTLPNKNNPVNCFMRGRNWGREECEPD